MAVERINKIVTINGKKIRDREDFLSLSETERRQVSKYRRDETRINRFTTIRH